jgi:hypothetical protein
MDTECQKIEYILGLPRVGGKIFCRDSNTILLMDCEVLSNQKMLQLQQSLPHLQIDIVSSEQSVSGFVVMFTRIATGVQVIIHVVHIILNLGILAFTMSKLFHN